MDVEKTMEFIVQQQALMDINFNRLVEAQDNTKQKLAALAEDLQKLATRVDRPPADMDRFRQADLLLQSKIEAVNGSVHALVHLYESILPRLPGQ